MLFDWATQPHYTLVQTFLFAPYFANAIVQNPVCGTLIAEGSEKAACGQALWGYAAAVAGCCCSCRCWCSSALPACS